VLRRILLEERGEYLNAFFWQRRRIYWRSCKSSPSEYNPLLSLSLYRRPFWLKRKSFKTEP